MWLYKNKEINSLEDLEKDSIGFIYKIHNILTNEYYYGKKLLQSITNKKLGKKELKNLPTKQGRKPTKKKVIKESNWLSYWGSNKDLLVKLKEDNYINWKKEIIMFVKTKKQLSLYELLYISKSFEDKKCLNGNILGKYFQTDLIN